jgi:hypothetical protein
MGWLDGVKTASYTSMWASARSCTLGGKNKQNKYTMNGNEMEEVEVEKDVGVMVANNLKTSQQQLWQQQLLQQLAKLMGFLGK